MNVLIYASVFLFCVCDSVELKKHNNLIEGTCPEHESVDDYSFLSYKNYSKSLIKLKRVFHRFIIHLFAKLAYPPFPTRKGNKKRGKCIQLGSSVCHPSQLKGKV